MSLALAYLAGVIDSDGTIGIKRSTYAMRVTKDCAQPTFSERICIRQVDREAVDLAAETFGGVVHLRKPQLPNGRPLYEWQVTDKIAARALDELVPFLRIKRVQAENALALRALKETSKRERVAVGRGHIGSARRSPEMSDRMEQLFERAKALNTTGIERG